MCSSQYVVYSFVFIMFVMVCSTNRTLYMQDNLYWTVFISVLGAQYSYTSQSGFIHSVFIYIYIRMDVCTCSIRRCSIHGNALDKKQFNIRDINDGFPLSIEFAVVHRCLWSRPALEACILCSKSCFPKWKTSSSLIMLILHRIR